MLFLTITGQLLLSIKKNGFYLKIVIIRWSNMNFYAIISKCVNVTISLIQFEMIKINSNFFKIRLNVLDISFLNKPWLDFLWNVIKPLVEHHAYRWCVQIKIKVFFVFLLSNFNHELDVGVGLIRFSFWNLCWDEEASDEERLVFWPFYSHERINKAEFLINHQLN